MAKVKKEKVREILARTWAKESQQVDLTLIKDLIEKNKIIGGYCQRDGELSNGKLFVQIYLTLEPD